MSDMQRKFLENIAVAAVYWLVSHLNWLIFSSVGVLPMPIWPAAAVAITAALYRGWSIAPGLALGTILANHFSLGAPWGFAFCIAVMNTLAPVLGALLIKKNNGGDLHFRSVGNMGFAIVVGVLLVPLLTALGGIGSKFMLGMLPESKVVISIMRWAMAHALGTVIFAVPYFAWQESRVNHGN
ncbi:MASE1 domain-containing protein [Desulfovibrio sp. JC022]|uniref:MASE1 domain-containing protein n=1 Tax=Desulfovibrio sp. JC022 TaxID=2593642 RepID=UPI0013D6B144|nr:MASE1 domain-containing protein [Desulfovibrio sp. JC022]NDV22423.1 hypothetical protein [Desulfovibrio sp. JC022]